MEGGRVEGGRVEGGRVEGGRMEGRKGGRAEGGRGESGRGEGGRREGEGGEGGGGRGERRRQEGREDEVRGERRGGLSLHLSKALHYRYGMGYKKFPFLETRYLATVILCSVFVSVLFYNFPCFYCCVSILKVRHKERLKNGAKNSVKTVQKNG